MTNVARVRRTQGIATFCTRRTPAHVALTSEIGRHPTLNTPPDPVNVAFPPSLEGRATLT